MLNIAREKGALYQLRKIQTRYSLPWCLSAASFHNGYPEPQQRIEQPQNSTPIVPWKARLFNYNKLAVDLKRECCIKIHHGKNRGVLWLINTQAQLANLLGSEWYKPLGIKLTGLQRVLKKIQDILEEFSKIFKKEFSMYKDPPVSSTLDTKVELIWMKPYHVTFTFHLKTDAEIDRLEEQAVLEAVVNPSCSTPIVPIMKPRSEHLLTTSVW